MSRMGVKPKEKPILQSDMRVVQLDVYAQHYYALKYVREEAERAAKYFNGDQWHEMVKDRNGNLMREDDYILSQGKLPLKQNLIKSTLRTLEGQFRTDTSKSVVVSSTPEKQKESEMLSNALQYCLDTVNCCRDLDARSLEKFLISGIAIQRISWEYIPELNRRDLRINNVNMNDAFFNGDIQDIRGSDIRIIGRLIDSTMDEMIVNYGTTPERIQEIKNIYGYASREYYTPLEANNPTFQYRKDFYVPVDIHMCRVIEVWEKRLTQRMEIHDWMDGTKSWVDWTQQQLDRANELRLEAYAELGTAPEEVPLIEGKIQNVQKWYFTYYTPWGHVLREGETPFRHGSHPFVSLAYPLLDGKIIGLGTDLIDSNRQINRLMILQDMILSSSVKNTLLIDKNSMDGQTREKIGADFKEVGGVVVWDSQGGKNVLPTELKGSVGNMGIPEMIQLYVQMLQDVSGVHPAMQGQSAASGTSGRLYDAQIMQSNLNSKDVMDTFTGLFRRNRDMKVLQTIQQFWDEPRMIAVAGKSYADTAQLYDPTKTKDIEFDLVIGQTADSPVYRSVIEDTLKEFVIKGLIDLKTFLSNTTMPYGAKMLEDIKKAEEQAQTDPRMAVQGLAQNVQEANIGADPNVVSAAMQGIKQ
jgi:hypothetical protein